MFRKIHKGVWEIMFFKPHFDEMGFVVKKAIKW